MNTKTEAASLPEFKGLRAILWPIHNFELKKFLPMGLMMIFILFNYTLLRDTKDAIIVNAPGSGAEALAFVKLYGTTPAAVLFMLIYVKLANALSKEGLFYATLVPFLVFFGAFAFIIYPNRALLHMSEETIKTLQAAHPHFKWFVPVIGNWSYSLFYILSELWGSVVIALLFWQFANEITKVSEAKRFYGMFGLLGNLGLIVSGPTVYYFSKMRDKVPEGVDPWGMTLNYLMGFVMLAGLMIVAIYYWMNRNVLTDPRFYEVGQVSGKKKDKPKLSVGESLKYIMSSPYLGLIAVLLLSYGISINVVEGVWKKTINLNFPNPNDYNAFMGGFSTVTGIVTLVTMIIGNNILRRFSWFTAAIITPLMILVTSLIFFGVIIYGHHYAILQDPSFVLLGIPMLFFAVLVGMTQNVLGKSTKYSLFDPTKEMSYIPLDQELKVKGKAAVDVIGGRAGKAGGAVVQTVLLITFAGQSLISLAPFLAGVVIIIVAAWIAAVTGLSKRFQALVKSRAESSPEPKNEPKSKDVAENAQPA